MPDSTQSDRGNVLSPALSELSAAPDLPALHPLLAHAGFGPGWQRPQPSLWPSPKKNFLPAQWHYRQARAALENASRHVTTEMAERRNLIMINPLEGNIYATLRTLVAAYQLVLPHEDARSHRHSPNALRLVVDTAPETYTIVDGKRIPMLPGDVLLTPNWAWHGHDNCSDESAWWIDFLDVPLVQLLEPMFFEPYSEQHAARLEASSEIATASPMRFAWSDTRARIDQRPDLTPGLRTLQLGPPYLQTIGLFVWRIEAGSAVTMPATTANSIFAVIEGSGESSVDRDSDQRRFVWQRGDVVAVPAWRPFTHTATATSYLLRVTDEPLMRQLGWFRKEGAAPATAAGH